MPKYMGYKPSYSNTRSKLGEPAPPKPSNQGDAKMSGPGSGAMRPAIRGGNSMAKPGRGRLATNSIKSPGSGTRGSGRTKNSVPKRG